MSDPLIGTVHSSQSHVPFIEPARETASAGQTNSVQKHGDDTFFYFYFLKVNGPEGNQGTNCWQ